MRKSFKNRSNVLKVRQEVKVGYCRHALVFAYGSLLHHLTIFSQLMLIGLILCVFTVGYPTLSFTTGKKQSKLLISGEKKAV